MTDSTLMPIYYRDEMVADAFSFSRSPLKPAAFARMLPRMHAAELVSFEPATREQIKLAHHPDYVDGVLDGRVANGFGNRSEAVARSLPYTVGSMVAAVRDVLVTARHGRGRAVACSPTSGFHHANHAHGGGFCTFNGLMVAALVARQEGLCERVYIIDGDQHWGDGTDDIIRKLGLRWVQQFHGPRTNAAEYFRALDAAWPQMERADLIIYQAGADIHLDDPLGGILSTADMRERDLRLRVLADAKPFAWNLAGGYQLDEAGTTPDEQLAPVLALHVQTQRVLAGADAGTGR